MSDKARILIVDDDADYRASARALLEGEGYAVLEAATGREGLARAKAERPDLILLDVMMEHVGEGYTINQALKFSEEYAELRDTPVVMVSTVETDPQHLFGWIGDTSRITPDAYLTKPLDIPKLLACVRGLLKRDQG